MAIDAPFEISETGETTKEKWFGKFRAKTILSSRDYITKDRLRREMLGAAGAGDVDVRARNLAIIISELAVRLTVFPKWWAETDNGNDFADDNVLRKVFDESLRVEREAFEERNKSADEAVTELRKDLAQDK